MQSVRHSVGCGGLMGLLFMLLAGCQPGAIPTILTPIPTELPTTTPLPTATYTLTPVPVWRILFSGFPCDEERDTCQPFDDTRDYYYSINSDGTDLREIPAFPSLPVPPESLPPHYLMPPPQLSPDGSHWAYLATDGLYIFDVRSGKTRRLFQSSGRPGGAICWISNDSIKFDVRSERNGEWLDTFYSIDLNGEHLRPLFTLSGLGYLVNTGDCSPGKQELAFSPGVGLYILDLNNGKWRKILSDYSVWIIRTAPIEDSELHGGPNANSKPLTEHVLATWCDVGTNVNGCSGYSPTTWASIRPTSAGSPYTFSSPSILWYRAGQLCFRS